MAQRVKNLLAIQETQETLVLSLGCEDLLEKGMATHASILAWRIPLWTEEPGGLQSMGLKESDTTEQLSTTHQGQGQDKNPDLPPTVPCSVSYNPPQQFISLPRHFFP